MSFSDFVSNWDAVQMCHLNADSYSDELLKETYVIHSIQFNIFFNVSSLILTKQNANLMWKCKTYQSEWKSGSTAGGSGNSNQGS